MNKKSRKINEMPANDLDHYYIDLASSPDIHGKNNGLSSQFCLCQKVKSDEKLMPTGDI